ncbi:NAD(P)-dependent alcohol dehydrogenase [Nocardia aurantia]|uniref:Geraniol dehydrogenase n=1 Tax=Nocardia aurantia TaxID=2585199 RepID=A0A7K0DJC2_9NOCA|nr:NAD(P)-dependent alcohol dehydrogenase [Nocardia aurantia]MQY25916.1 Geraniol dehydrogenase [Nocardia aurantia]
MDIIAAVARGADAPFTVEAATLRPPGPGEVLVRVVAAGICHTDLSARRNFPADLPIVLGHEGAGVVEAVGDGVTAVATGDHVLVTYSSCGACRYCAAGHPGYCAEWVVRNGGRFGEQSPLRVGGEPVVGGFFGQSSFASHIVTGVRNLVRVGPDVNLTRTAAFGCGIQTGAGAVANVLRPPAGATVAIFGTGGVGMAALLAARALGAGTVVAVDIAPARLELARALGADVVVDGAEPDVAARIADATHGGVSHALDTTGLAPVIAQAIDALAPLGTLALVALGEPTLPIEVAKLIGQGKTLRGCLEGDGDPQHFLPVLLDWFRRGLFPMDRLIRTYPLGKINDAVADCASGAVVKPVLTFE